MAATVSITSNEGTLDSASAVLEVTATNPEYNQPALRIKQAGKRGGAASIRIDDPNPDIEFVETDQVAPAGKYEILAVNYFHPLKATLTSSGRSARARAR